METPNVKAEYLDCCLPDFFQGYAGNGSDTAEVLAVPVHSATTYREALDDLIDDYNGSCGPINDAEPAIREMFSDISDMDSVADFVKYVEDPTEEEADMYDSVYLYVGLRV